MQLSNDKQFQKIAHYRRIFPFLDKLQNKILFTLLIDELEDAVLDSSISEEQIYQLVHNVNKQIYFALQLPDTIENYERDCDLVEAMAIDSYGSMIHEMVDRGIRQDDVVAYITDSFANISSRQLPEVIRRLSCQGLLPFVDSEHTSYNTINEILLQIYLFAHPQVRKLHPVHLNSFQNKIADTVYNSLRKLRHFPMSHIDRWMKRMQKYLYRSADFSHLKEHNHYQRQYGLHFLNSNAYKNLLKEVVLIDLLCHVTAIPELDFYLASNYDDKIGGFDMVIDDKARQHIHFIDITRSSKSVDEKYSKINGFFVNQDDKQTSNNIAKRASSEFVSYMKMNQSRKLCLSDESVVQSVIHMSSKTIKLMSKYYELVLSGKDIGKELAYFDFFDPDGERDSCAKIGISVRGEKTKLLLSSTSHECHYDS